MNEQLFESEKMNILEYNTIIIGSGAAGLNCALHLLMEGLSTHDIAIITEELGGGTSFNTGSDKQTYYKLSIIGEQSDSPYEMAKDLFSGGAMHGDIALVEATNSVREFMHLVNLGVPFPHDEFGAYVGYKTDNDPRQRATSIGPLTSQEMGKCLLKEVQAQKIKIYDNFKAIKILTKRKDDYIEAIGLVCLDKRGLSKAKNFDNLKTSIRVLKARNVIIATGGPAILYKNSVYPISQKGSMGIAIEAGCVLQNLTESQFGLASVKFRWNVSGSYQQVIPRYVSIDKEGREREFLNQYFPSFLELSKAIFLKGYQWPFNPERIVNLGSSLIDLAVYYETEMLGRRVYLDFQKNPENFTFDGLHDEAKAYLENSEALGDTPIKRLEQMNEEAINLFLDHDINLMKEKLEISVCNQHLNGGLAADIWWESVNVHHLFPIGEVNGSHGVHRPGGSALNSGQVGGMRVAQRIAHNLEYKKSLEKEEFLKIIKSQLNTLIKECKEVFNDSDPERQKNFSPEDILRRLQNRMAKYGSFIRPLNGLKNAISDCEKEYHDLEKIIEVTENKQFSIYFQLKDALLSQATFLNAILNYHQHSGSSRGSFIILRNSLNEELKERYISPSDKLPQLKFILSEQDLSNQIQTIKYLEDEFKTIWVPRREIPQQDSWFETILKKFNEGNVFSKK